MKRFSAMMVLAAFAALSGPLAAAEATVESVPPIDWSTWVDPDIIGSGMDHVVGEELCAAPASPGVKI